MNTIPTREAMIVHIDGRPVLDMDPIELEHNGDVASAFDDNLELILASMDEYTDEFGGLLRLVWSDGGANVLVECPSCECVKAATAFNVADVDADGVVCDDCN